MSQKMLSKMHFLTENAFSCPSFPWSFRKYQGKPQKHQGFLSLGEPLKTLENRQKTPQKTKEFRSKRTTKETKTPRKRRTGHFPTGKKCTFLQKNAVGGGARGKKPQEIAGGFQGSRIKNAGQLSSSLRAKGTLISEPRISTPCEMRFFPREKGKRPLSRVFL